MPYDLLQLSPAVPALQYGMQVFEGMKAYHGVDGNARLFRPDLNMARFLMSSERLSLPSFDKSALKECLMQLVSHERDWIPKGRGLSLYIRPTHIATQPSLGVGPSTQSLLYIILSPVGTWLGTPCTGLLGTRVACH